MTPDLNAAKQRADRLAAALEHSGIGDWTWDRERDVMTLSPAAARISSVAPGEHHGWERMRGLIHPEDRDRARIAAQRAIQEGVPYEVEARVRGPEGWRWVLSRGRADTDENGVMRGLVGTIEDITRRKREEEADRLLAQIGDTVASSVDVPAMLDELGRVLIQRFADGCAIDLLEPDDTVRRVVLVTRDPVKADLVRELEERFPTPMDAEAGNVMAIRSGQPHLFPVITDEILRAASASDEHLDLWYRIDMRSVICVPLIARGRTIGAISIVSHTEGLHYDDQDLALAVEVARRAALAIDTAQAHERAERGAERMARLQALTAALSEAVTVDEVASVVVRHGIADLGASAGVLVALTPGDEIEIVASVGYPEGSGADRGRRYPLASQTPGSEAVRTGRSVFVESLSALERFDARPITDNHAWAAIPLMRQGQPNGAIVWAYVEPRAFTPADSALMESIASLTAQALERAMLYEAEREARAAAELANGAKSRFLAMMSHELRTPLNAIVGYSDLMAHGVGAPLGDLQRGYIERIRGSAMFLSQIIQEILAFSQLEAGREDVVAEEIDAREIVSEAAGMVRPMALSSGLELNVDVPDEPVPVRTDQRKLTQVVLNLLSNAVKFTERGAVSVSLAVENDSLVVRVADTGVGISADALEKVFEPFTQVDSSPTRRQGGTGLGLTVAARLARVLGGRIEASSDPGRGSVFTVVVPLSAPTVAERFAAPGIVAETKDPS